MNEPLYTYEKFKRKIIFYHDKMVVYRGVVKEINYEDIIKINRKSEHFISLQLPDKKRPYRLPIRSDDDEVFELLIKFLENFGREFVEIQGERELKAPTSDFFDFNLTRQFYTPLIFGLSITFLSLLQNCYFIWFGITVLIGAALSMVFNVRSIILEKSTVLIEGFLFRYEIPYESIKYFKNKGFYCIDSKSFLASNVKYDEGASLKQSLFQHGALQGNEVINSASKKTAIIKASLSAAFGIGTFLALVASIVPFILLLGGIFYEYDSELWEVKDKKANKKMTYILSSKEMEKVFENIEVLNISKKEWKLLKNYLLSSDKEIPEDYLKLYKQNQHLLNSVSNLADYQFRKIELNESNSKESELSLIRIIAVLNLFDAKVNFKQDEKVLYKNVRNNLKLATYLSYKDQSSSIIAQNIADLTLEFLRKLGEEYQLQEKTLIQLQSTIKTFNQEKAPYIQQLRHTSLLVSNTFYKDFYEEMNGDKVITKIILSSLNFPEKEELEVYCQNIEKFLESPFTKEKLASLSKYREKYYQKKYFDRLSIHPNSFNGYILGFAIEDAYLILQDQFYYQPIFETTSLHLAVSQFKHEKQRLPKALNELIPKYIEKIPRDLLTNYSTKIKYEVFDDGSWQLSNDKSLLKDFIVGFSTDETSVFVEKELSRYEIHKLKQ